MENVEVLETEGRTLSAEEQVRLQRFAIEHQRQTAASQQKRQDRLVRTLEILRERREK